jgi:hypothetical protein
MEHSVSDRESEDGLITDVSAVNLSDIISKVSRHCRVDHDQTDTLVRTHSLVTWQASPMSRKDSRPK